MICFSESLLAPCSFPLIFPIWILHQSFKYAEKPAPSTTAHKMETHASALQAHTTHTHTLTWHRRCHGKLPQIAFNLDYVVSPLYMQTIRKLWSCLWFIRAGMHALNWKLVAFDTMPWQLACWVCDSRSHPMCPPRSSRSRSIPANQRFRSIGKLSHTKARAVKPRSVWIIGQTNVCCRFLLFFRLNEYCSHTEMPHSKPKRAVILARLLANRQTCRERSLHRSQRNVHCPPLNHCANVFASEI